MQDVHVKLNPGLSRQLQHKEEEEEEEEDSFHQKVDLKLSRKEVLYWEHSFVSC